VFDVEFGVLCGISGGLKDLEIPTAG